MLSVVMLSVALSVFMLSVMLSVILLSVVMLNSLTEGEGSARLISLY
jgi:hypothetical protein